jgi:DMSO/TMAO reductase YedYZ molybdopterin-dependent catalytic subunit
MRRTSTVAFAVLFLSIFVVAQQAKPLLKIDGKVASPLTFTQQEWAKLPRATVAFKGHSKEATQYEGVPLKLLLERAGVFQADKPMHGKELLQYVIVNAADGYRVLFSIGELEDATSSTSNVLLADKANGKPLGDNAAPLQLIVPADKRPARCVRMVSSITVGIAAD